MSKSYPIQDVSIFLQLASNEIQFEKHEEEYEKSQIKVSNQEINGKCIVNIKKKVKSTKKVQFHYKKKRRYSKNKKNNVNNHFTLEDDQKILNLVASFGPKFDKIAQEFQDKKAITLKNRYYKVLRYSNDDNINSQNNYDNYQSYSDYSYQFGNHDVNQDIYEEYSLNFACFL